MSGPSYHDVTIYVNGKSYLPSQDYDLVLNCTKVAGWRLFRIENNAEQLIGGEYDSEEFRIEVAGQVICKRENEVEQNANKTA